MDRDYCVFFVSLEEVAGGIAFRSSATDIIMYEMRIMLAATIAVIAAYVELPRK